MIKRLFAYAKRAFYVYNKLPRQVDIEISTMCNLNCKMCKRQKLDFGNKFMDFEDFKKIIDKIPKDVEIISFGGYGEMLLHPRFFDILKYTKEKGFLVQVTSNGLLLTENYIPKLFEAGLDKLSISIEHITPPKGNDAVGHTYSEQVINNIKNLARLREEKKNSMKICINTVVHKGNFDDIIDIIRFAESLKIDSIELIRLDTCLNSAERTLLFEKEKELYQKIEKMNKNIKIITPLNRFSRWRCVFQSRKDFCPCRAQAMHVRVNGKVTPCAFGYSFYDFGDIYKMELKEVWQSEVFKNVRKNKDNNPVCEKCSIFKWPY